MAKETKLEIVLEVDLGSKLGQCRAAPVRLGSGAPRAFVAVYSSDVNIDPGDSSFFFPEDTLKMALVTVQGEILWKRDLGRGVIPAIWFCPVYPFDMDGDGVDEIWFVNNNDARHPFARRKFTLDRVDALTGQTTGQWPWPLHYDEEPFAYTFRYFLLGGYSQGQPILVSGQGTYLSMHLQGWNADMSQRWLVDIGRDDPGARGSHMCPVADINFDGIDEILWGERCLSIEDGRELFCADRDQYNGHSDVVLPVMDWDNGSWSIYTCREGYYEVPPRVVMYDSNGNRKWGSVDYGHLHMGWVARLGPDRELIVAAIREGDTAADGTKLWDEYAFHAMTGEPCSLPFCAVNTLPVDVNGDGYHEIVTYKGHPQGGACILDRHGKQLGYIGGAVAMASRFMDRPGEQLLAFYEDGKLRIWADRNAEDCPEASRRYNHRYYTSNQRVTAVGYNTKILCGI